MKKNISILVLAAALLPLLFSCNNIPKNYGDRSEGFYRRLIIIRFDHAVPENKKDPDLLDKLRLEADGIFLFALEGLKRLIKNRYVEISGGMTI